jgi:hypothetical protein
MMSPLYIQVSMHIVNATSIGNPRYYIGYDVDPERLQPHHP